MEIKKHYCIKSIPLHIDKTMIEQEFYQVFNNRKSVEELEIRTRISFEKLSNLLHFSYGYVNKEHNVAPSAGAKYPISIYIVIFNVENLEQGIYYYNKEQDTLELIRKGNIEMLLIISILIIIIFILHLLLCFMLRILIKQVINMRIEDIN